MTEWMIYYHILLPVQSVWFWMGYTLALSEFTTAKYYPGNTLMWYITLKIISTRLMNTALTATFIIICREEWDGKIVKFTIYESLHVCSAMVDIYSQWFNAIKLYTVSHNMCKNITQWKEFKCSKYKWSLKKICLSVLFFSGGLFLGYHVDIYAAWTKNSKWVSV